MNQKLTAKDYLKIVEWSEEDGCFVGTCPGLFLGGVHGEDEAKVYAELVAAVEEAIATKAFHGDPLPPAFARRDFTGKFVLRLDPELHKLLSIRAFQIGASLNQFCVDVLARQTGQEAVRKVQRATGQMAQIMESPDGQKFIRRVKGSDALAEVMKGKSVVFKKSVTIAGRVLPVSARIEKKKGNSHRHRP